MAASGRHGAPCRHGRADMGVDAALWIESTVQWWTEPVRGNLGCPSRSNDADVYRGSGLPGKKRMTAAPWPA